MNWVIIESDNVLLRVRFQGISSSNADILDHKKYISIIFYLKSRAFFILENTLENVACKMVPILSRPQSVKVSWSIFSSCHYALQCHLWFGLRFATRMQIWAYVHKHLWACLHACTQVSCYAYILIVCRNVRSIRSMEKSLSTPVIC